MRESKQVAKRLIVEAIELGIADARVERGKKHPRLVGSIYDIAIMVVLRGSSRDTNAFSISRQHLRREVLRARTLHEERNYERQQPCRLTPAFARSAGRIAA